MLSGQAKFYPAITGVWPQLGTIENDGYYVLRLTSPPFINLTTGKLRGLVDITYLTDKSCTECYDVNLHRLILTNPQTFAMVPEKEETTDISDAKGKELIAKYNITKVPTVILSSEASVYPSAKELNEFFSIEKDGSYVFKSVQILGTHKDLVANQVVKVQQAQEEPNE